MRKLLEAIRLFFGHTCRCFVCSGNVRLEWVDDAIWATQEPFDRTQEVWT